MGVPTRPLPRYAWLDVLAVLVLAAVALAGFRTTFGDTRWMLVAGAGVTIATGWALLLVGLRLGMDLVVESLPIPYVFTAGGIALGSSGLLLGVPDGETLGDVITGTWSGWRELVETAPPLDSRGPAMLVVFLLAMAAAGTATAIAVRSRRAALPLLPLLLLLGGVLVLGVHRPVSVLLQGVGFGAVALAWLGHRGARNQASRDADDDVRRVSGGRLVAAVVTVAVAGALVVPLADASTDRRWVLREAVEPYDSASVTTPLSQFRRFRPGTADSLAGEVLFAVRGVEPGATLRIAVLDDYDGVRWLASSDSGPDDVDDRFLRVASTVDNPSPGASTRATVRARRDWDLDWLPVVGRVQAFDFYDDVDLFRRDAVRYNRSTGTALLPGGLEQGDEYVLDTVVPSDRLTPRMQPWPERDRRLWRAAKFLDVPARAWSLGATDPMDAVFDVAERLRRRGRYSDGGPGWLAQFTAGQERERLLEGFVDADQMVGNDEQYAATMALLANRLGVPARVVVGARLRAGEPVRGRDVGAWVEVRIADGSWRSLPTDSFMGHRPPDRDAEPLPPVRLPKVPPGSVPSPGQQPAPEQLPDDEPLTAPAPSEQQAEESGTAWWWWLVVPLGLVLLVPGAKALRRARRRAAGPASRQYVAAWEDLLDAATDLGLSVAHGPRPAQAASLGVPPGLAREADVASFAEEPPASAREFRERVRAARADLLAGVPAWRRWLAPVNPASLLRR